MTDSKPPAAELPAQPAASASEIKVDAKPAKPTKPPNPLWKMMGLPNLPKKLPSRNWMIFWTLTGSLAGAIIYDKREKKRAQRKWCKLVEHLKDEHLDARSMPRRLTIVLETPPADGLRFAQDHFKDYVKPILVASGIDWEFIQGRKEGDVRAELAEKIRKQRSPFDPDDETEDPILRVRANNGTKEYDGPQGDIVIGRNTWKEYVRGLHEGWLGPLTEPNPPPQPESAVEEAKAAETIKTDAGITLLSEPRDANPEDVAATTDVTPEAEKSKKPPQPKPFITTSEYSAASLPAGLPDEFAPTNPIPLPHILGFLNTPKRFWRFLHRRELADSIGRDVAAVILHSYGRPYESNVGTSFESSATSFVSDSPSNSDDDASAPPSIPQNSEQAQALIDEEKEWHKSIKKPIPDVAVQPERTWLEPVVLDPRIASRMRRAELTADEEERAKSFKIPESEIEGWIKGGIRSLFQAGISWAKGEGKVSGPDIGDPDRDSVTGEGPVTANQGFVPGVVGGMRMPSPTQAQGQGAGAGKISRFQ